MRHQHEPMRAKWGLLRHASEHGYTSRGSDQHRYNLHVVRHGEQVEVLRVDTDTHPCVTRASRAKNMRRVPCNTKRPHLRWVGALLLCIVDHSACCVCIHVQSRILMCMPTGQYDRSKRRLTPEQRKASARLRLSKRIEINADGCWLWQGAVTNGGYGRIQMPDGTGQSKAKMAHRVSYELHKGPIPDGLQLDHLCRVRNCVNPDHLEPVEGTENLWRSPLTVARLNGSKTHCKNGHEFTEANTYRAPKEPQYRQCRTCRTENMRLIRQRRRERAVQQAA